MNGETKIEHTHRDRLLAAVARRVIAGESPLVAPRELVLLPVGVERRERVLPLPHHDDPDEDQSARHGQGRPGGSQNTSHIHPSNAFRPVSDACLLALTVRAICLTVCRIGPRGGRSAALGYGA